MKIITLKEFSGVPKYTMGEAVRDGELFKITWNLKPRLFGLKQKPFDDWFDEWEFKTYLRIIGT